MHAALTMRKCITEIHTYEYDITHKRKKKSIQVMFVKSSHMIHEFTSYSRDNTSTITSWNMFL